MKATSKLRRIQTYGERLWTLLVTPAAMENPKQLKEARFLASFLVSVLPLGIFLVFVRYLYGDNPADTVRIGVPTLGLIFIAYGLSRTRYYSYGMMLLILSTSIAVFLGMIVDPGESFLIIYLSFSSVLGVLLLTTRAAFILLAGNVAGAFLIQTLISQQPLVTFAEELVYFATISTLFGVVVIIRQRDALRIQEQAQLLAMSEYRYRTLIEQAVDPVITTDAQGCITYCNPPTEQLTGYSVDELGGMYFSELISPDWRTAFERLYVQQPDSAQHEVMLQFPLMTREGQRKWIEPRMTPLLKDEIIVGYQGIVQDVTAKKEAEDALVAERNLLRTLIDNLPDYIFIKNTQGHILINNKAHARLLGHEEVSGTEGITGEHWHDPAIFAGFRADDERVLRTKQAMHNREEQLIDEHGQLRYVLTTKVPLFDVEGEVTGLVGIAHDVSDLKEIQQKELDLAAERERVMILSQFIADTSHDLKTPLTTMHTGLYLLERDLNTSQSRGRLASLQAQVDYLARVIDNMLDMSRLDAQSATHLTAVNLSHLLSQLSQSYVERASEHSYQFTLSVSDNVTVTANVAELGRAINNLIDNAFKFTPHGGQVALRSRLQDHQVVIEVQDSGIGMTADHLEKIFDRFYRVEKSRNQATGGTGLGLAIVKRIVELHNGRIEVESTPGEGSLFRIVLPVSTTD